MHADCRKAVPWKKTNRWKRAGKVPRALDFFTFKNRLYLKNQENGQNSQEPLSFALFMKTDRDGGSASSACTALVHAGEGQRLKVFAEEAGRARGCIGPRLFEIAG